MFVKKSVFASWRCKNINKMVYVSEDAVYSGKSGWICDCGEWTTGKDGNHTAEKQGIREVFMK